MDIKAGIGIDIHPLVAGRKLILAGVEINFDKGLAGHSDGDALTHSICDAILGALGLGDIGQHFPDTDPQYQDISSLLLLKKVAEMAAEMNYKVNNIDATIVCERPQLAPLLAKMAASIKSCFSRPPQVNIKATRAEGLGFIGQGQGIMAMAVASLSSQIISV